MAREKTKEELEREYRSKSASYERKLKSKHSKFVVVSVTFILIGYLFFLLSPKIFLETPERFYTELGTNVSFTGGVITPNSWIFAKSRNMMQVEFSFRTNQILAPSIEVSAAVSYKDRTKSASRLKADIIYNETNFYIANIYDIPDDYYCVSLRIKTVEEANTESTYYVNNKDGLGNQVLDELNERENPSENKEITSTASIYTCCDAVETVDSIYPLYSYIYRIKRIQSNINIDYADISKNDSEIRSLNKDNDSLRAKNDKLTDEMLYMTSSEKQVNQREIDSNNTKIRDNLSKIALLQESNQSLYNEIKEYEEIIRRIAAENEGREYIAPSEPSEEPTEQNTPSESTGTDGDALSENPT